MMLARFISFVSNPIFILIALPYFLVFKSTKDTYTAFLWSLYTFCFLLVFALFVLIGVRKKYFSDLDVSIQNQRPVLYFVAALLSLFYLFGLFLLHGPPILFITIIGIMLGIFIGSLINIKVKASVHVAAMSALLTSLSAVYGGYFLLSLLFIPLICWARIEIKRHTLKEVVTGGVFGILLALFMYFTSKNIIFI